MLDELPLFLLTKTALSHAAHGNTFLALSGTAPKVIIKGESEEKRAEARGYVVEFAKVLAENGFKKKDALGNALNAVLGDVPADQVQEYLQSVKAGAKNANGASNTAISKIDFNKITIREFEPRTENQRIYLDLIRNEKYRLVLAQGPAGTGKTSLFLQEAMKAVCNHYRGDKTCPRKLIISIPCENVGGSKQPALPGDQFKKTELWFGTYYNHLVRILAPTDSTGYPDLAAGEKLMKDMMEAKIIEIAQLEHLRGKSFGDAWIACDEAQNASKEQIKTFLTRAENDTARMFVFGDAEQKDRKPPIDGEFYKVPSTVSINKAGVVTLNKNGRFHELGFFRDIADFQTGNEVGEVARFSAHNGFAHAMIAYTGSPHVACLCLTTADTQRGPLTRDILDLDRGLRIVGTSGVGAAPVGSGVINPQTILDDAERVAARPPQTVGGESNVVQLRMA